MLESIGVVDVGTYALGSLLIVLCPGPNSIFVLKTGISSGPRVALSGACGVFLGDLPRTSALRPSSRRIPASFSQ